MYYDVERAKELENSRLRFRLDPAMNFGQLLSILYSIYKQNMPEHIRQRLTSVAEAILILDKEMSVVRDEIMDAQNYLR